MHGHELETKEANSTKRVIASCRLQLDRQREDMDRKREQLSVLKRELERLEVAHQQDEDAMAVEIEKQDRTRMFLETVHSRGLEAAENRENYATTIVVIRQFNTDKQVNIKSLQSNVQKVQRMCLKLEAMKNQSLGKRSRRRVRHTDDPAFFNLSSI